MKTPKYISQLGCFQITKMTTKNQPNTKKSERAINKNILYYLQSDSILSEGGSRTSSLVCIYMRKILHFECLYKYIVVSDGNDNKRKRKTMHTNINKNLF